MLPGVGNCQYTALTTAGTTTLNAGQAAGVASQPGVLYGMLEVAAGTSFAATFYDLIPGAAVTTNTLLSGTGTAGQNIPAGPPGVGVRYRGALVVITSGTPGIINALWD